MKLKLASAAVAVAGLTAFAAPMAASAATPPSGSGILHVVIGTPTTCLPTIDLGIIKITLCL